MKSAKGSTGIVKSPKILFEMVRKAIQDKETALLLVFLSTIFILGYLIPVMIYSIPTGTDTFHHMFYTEEILKSDSLDDFYKNCFGNKYNTCDYPFGLRLFGSIILKITGIGIYELSYILPLLLIISAMCVYYVYADMFLHSRKLAIISIMFLLSMPIMITSLLQYSTSVFSISILLAILYFTFNEKISFIKRAILVGLFVFCLSFSHTGTYVFLMFLSLSYIIIYAVIWGKFHRDVYFLLVSIIIIYIISMWLFPYVQLQYIDKARLVLTVGDFFSSTLYMDFMNTLSQVFYTRVILEKSIVDAVAWSALIYTIIKLIVVIRSSIPSFSIKEKIKRLPLTIPLIGDVSRVSHSILATPFWIGPIQSLLSIIGVFKTDKKGATLLISVFFVGILPGALHTGPTGALKELFYFLIIIPITAALGFKYLDEFGKRNFTSAMRIAFFALFYFLVFAPLILLPIIGNQYYRPLVTEPAYERVGLSWLGEIGNPNEGASGVGYRHLIDVYADKKVPGATTVAYGSETRQFNRDVYNTYFVDSSEEYSDDLYSFFGVKYLIVSEGVLDNLGGRREELKITSNQRLDKIYTTKESFEIYNYHAPDIEEYHIEYEETVPQMNYYEEAPEFQDIGLDFLIETDSYKVRISKTRPEMKYLGSQNLNFLGEGYLLDYVVTSWYGGFRHGQRSYSLLRDLEYEKISMSKNRINYEGVIRNVNGTEKWSTIVISYTFYQNVIRKDVTIANDWVTSRGNEKMYVEFSSTQFSPMNYFTSYRKGLPRNKIIYPSQDSVKLSDIFESIYLNDGENGIYIEYQKNAPYPEEIIYKGSTQYNYSSVDLTSRRLVDYSDSLHISQLISVGEENTAKKSVEKYRTVSLLPYPEGKTPIVITGYLGSLAGMSDNQFTNSLNAFARLNEANATTYTIGLPLTEGQFSTNRIERILRFGRELIGYDNLYDSRSGNYYSDVAQKANIVDMGRIAQQYSDQGVVFNLRGIIPRSLNYNLQTIETLEDENRGFIIGTKANAPYMGLYENGLRYPKFAYFNGDETGVVILPVSMPTSDSLRPEYDVEKTLESWKAAIDASMKYDEMCLFVWNPDRVGMPRYREGVVEVVGYAQSKGLTFRRPDEIERHFKLLRNITTEVFNSIDNVQLKVHNENDVEVEGIGFKVVLPKIEGSCPYRSNGTIVRTSSKTAKCDIYISVDVDPMVTVLITVEPNLTKKQFSITLESEIVGSTLVSVKDASGIPVGKAVVYVDAMIFETDGNGLANIDVNRGSYYMKVEKAGFETETMILDVKGKVFTLWEIPIETYLLILASLILFALGYAFREMLYGHAVDKSKRGASGLKRAILKINNIIRRKR